jgi:hypothetical protein
MSFFSSLCLFYPGKPPQIAVGQLREFSARMRESISFEPWLQGVAFKYGKSIARDLKSTNLLTEIAPNMWQSLSYKWDHEANTGDCAWEELWPAPKQDAKSVYRADITFGGLPNTVCEEFKAIHPTDQSCYIVPDMASLSIDPFSPAALSDEESHDIIGFVSLSFAGNGYFSWRKDPFGSYWQAVRERPTLQRALQICRECFPVPHLPYLSALKADLGALFLNREEYLEGDWVVSVSESG